jgi:orotate phosphoribosyltransferase
MSDRERLKQIILELSYEKRLVTLASGRESDFYFDGKQTTLHAEGGFLVGRLFYQAIRDLDDVQAVGGITLGADPIATATSIAAYLDGKRMHAFIIRKEPKGHGTGQWLKVLGIVTLVDREEGGRENIEASGYWLRTIFTKSELVA